MHLNVAIDINWDLDLGSGSVHKSGWNPNPTEKKIIKLPEDSS